MFIRQAGRQSGDMDSGVMFRYHSGVRSLVGTGPTAGSVYVLSIRPGLAEQEQRSL